jgi:methionine-rich copper-binding protein CopC
MQRRIFALASLAFLAGGRAAFAHARLRSAVPAPGSMIDAAPTEVVLTFSERLEPRFSSIAVQDTAGRRFDDGPAQGGADGKTLAVKLKPLEPGDYTVVWHATSVDTHRTEGSFAFMLHG